MAIDLYTETSSSRTMSPRISFSHDLNNCDIIPIEQHHRIPLKSSLLDYDFDFNVSKPRCDQDSSLADELFANGVILPIQIKRKNLPTTIPKSKSLPHSSTTQNINISEAVNVGPHSHVTTTPVRHNDDNNNNKSFWQLKRSKSVNCGRIYRRGLCSLPLLSRSKSSGSTTSSNNVKKALIPKDEQQYYNTQRQASLKNLGSNNHQKPPLKKHYYGGSSFNSGLINVSPVINVTTGNLFGFCSIFSNGKDKAKKK